MINIAIDGFAGCGKGTVSEGLAKHFGFLHLDTGAIFRSLLHLTDLELIILPKMIWSRTLKNLRLKSGLKMENNLCS